MPRCEGVATFQVIFVIFEFSKFVKFWHIDILTFWYFDIVNILHCHHLLTKHFFTRITFSFTVIYCFETFLLNGLSSHHLHLFPDQTARKLSVTGHRQVVFWGWRRRRRKTRVWRCLIYRSHIPPLMPSGLLGCRKPAPRRVSSNTFSCIFLANTLLTFPNNYLPNLETSARWFCRSQTLVQNEYAFCKIRCRYRQKRSNCCQT